MAEIDLKQCEILKQGSDYVLEYAPEGLQKLTNLRAHLVETRSHYYASLAKFATDTEMGDNCWSCKLRKEREVVCRVGRTREAPDLLDQTRRRYFGVIDIISNR